MSDGAIVTLVVLAALIVGIVLLILLFTGAAAMLGSAADQDFSSAWSSLSSAGCSSCP